VCTDRPPQTLIESDSTICLLFRWIIPIVLISILNKSVCTSSTTNLCIVIKINYETWIAKQFIANYVRNLNYKTTCFGLWRPSSKDKKLRASPEFFVFCFIFLAFNFFVCGFEFLVFCVVVFVLLASVTLKLRLHLTHNI